MPTERTGVTSQATALRINMVTIPDSDSMLRTDSGRAFMAAALPEACRAMFSRRAITSLFVKAEIP